VYKPNFTESSSPAQSSNDRSMLNLYLKEEAKEEVSASDKLSRSVFNLYEKPTFPDHKEDSKEQPFKGSMMNLYLKEEKAQ
jgi:hypothetical protein